MAHLSTIAAFGFEDFYPPKLLKLYRQVGCRTCQFYRNPANPPVPDEARKVAESAGLPIDSVHGVFGPEHDPSSRDETVRRAAIETYRAEGVLALDLGGPMVVVHPAPRASEAGDITVASRAERIDPLRRSLEELAELGRSLGVTYLLENLPGDYEFGSNAAQVAELVRERESPHLRMCFDTGHAHMTGWEVDCLESCHDVVSYLHINDNDGRLDGHDIPGDGSINWPALAGPISRLPADIPATLELFISELTLQNRIRDGLPQQLKQWLALV